MRSFCGRHTATRSRPPTRRLYLDVTSAVAECGKTRLLEVLERVVSTPWLTGRTTAAALTRKVDRDHPTLLLDESDAAFKGEPTYAEALRGLLNSGYRRSGRLTMCVGQGANLSVRDFATFSAKALAGIGAALPGTVVSRAVTIILKRRLKSEPVAKFREREARKEAEPIRKALAAWAPTAVARLRDQRPDMPSGLRDRAEEVLEPLFAIADDAGGDWPARARAAAVALMGVERTANVAIDLLHDIREIFRAQSVTFIASNELLRQLVALEGRPRATGRTAGRCRRGRSPRPSNRSRFSRAPTANNAATGGPPSGTCGGATRTARGVGRPRD